MIKVDEIYPLLISASIGPSGTMRRLFASKESFYFNGIDMSIFAKYKNNNILFNRYDFIEMTSLPDMTFLPSTKSRIEDYISSIKNLVRKSILLSFLQVEFREVLPIRSSVLHYLHNKRQPDVVVFHEFVSAYFFLKHKNDSKVKTIVFLHCDGDVLNMFLKTYPKLTNSIVFRHQKKMFEFVISNCDRIVFISRIACDNFLKLYPTVLADKTTVVVNGIDDKSLSVQSHCVQPIFRMCCTGSVCERKGQYIVIDALSKLPNNLLKQIHFTIIGTGPDYNKLVKEVNRNGLKDNVTFMGNVPNDKVHAILEKNNIFILMSSSEGLPISIIEAMRAGLAIISTPIAGIPEEVDERNGLLINPKTDELVSVLHNLSLINIETLQKNSRKRFEYEYSFERMRSDYICMLNSLYSQYND